MHGTTNPKFKKNYGLIRTGTEWDIYVTIFILHAFPFISDFDVPSILCLVL